VGCDGWLVERTAAVSRGRSWLLSFPSAPATRVRVLWAIHEVASLLGAHETFRWRCAQPPLEPLVDWLFFIGLAWLGFSAKAILTVYAFNLFYQFFIHTEVIRRLPLGLEWILNSPSHHRVHHGSNAEYIDRNYGGTLIIWDRLLRHLYGRRGKRSVTVSRIQSTSRNPLLIAFHLWKELMSGSAGEPFLG
jgi:hypothetical protein